MLNPTDQKLFFVLLAVCTLLAARVVLRRVRVIASGAPMPAARSSFAERFKNLLVYVPGQWSNIRNIRLNDTAGLTHLFIFWGFYALVIYYAIFEVLHHGLGLFDGLPKHPVAIAFTQVVEILGCLLVFALLTAVGRRAILKLKRLGPHFEVVPMALLALAALLVVGCFLILQGVRDGYGLTTAGPVAELVAAWFTGADGEPMAGLYRTVWWTQAVLILIAIVYIPYSRHQHPIFAPFNIWLKDRRNEGRIIKIDVADIGKRPDGRAGAKLTSDFNQKQLLDLYACTQCGRCQDVCPAADTGKPLSPKAVVLDLMHHVDEQAGLLPFWEKAKGTETITDAIGRDSVWSCMTCSACNEVCPVGVEPMDKVIEARKDQVMNDADVPSEFVEMYRNLETAGDPWGYGPDKRTMWAAGLNIPVLGDQDDETEIDVLFWVGCKGAFDDNYRKVVRSFARVLQQAGVKFAILGAEERCTGDTARRTGNEWLFQQLANKNVETFMKYGIKRVVTTCPHCFNTLKNEYTEFGLELEVIHHTQLIASLMRSGDITVKQPIEQTVTYHDACYLGRYNDIVDAPREILSGLGAGISEPPRTGKSSRCCGAGGGMKDLNQTGTRVNEDRAAELLECSPDTLVTACPFCHEMIESGADAVRGDGDRAVATVDVVQLVEKAIITQ